MSINERRALVIVDVQRDFCEGGSLAVAGGAETAAKISRWLSGEGARYEAVVATRDHHIDPGGHFSATPDYEVSWPPHCVAGTPGEELHPDLDAGRIEAVFGKGERAAAYSGFEGRDDEGTSLAGWLRRRAITGVDIVGIASDYCVLATALDANAAGFATRVGRDLTVGVAAESTVRAWEELLRAGVELS